MIFHEQDLKTKNRAPLQKALTKKLETTAEALNKDRSPSQKALINKKDRQMRSRHINEIPLVLTSGLTWTFVRMLTLPSAKVLIS